MKICKKFKKNKIEICLLKKLFATINKNNFSNNKKILICNKVLI